MAAAAALTVEPNQVPVLSSPERQGKYIQSQPPVRGQNCGSVGAIRSIRNKACLEMRGI